MALFLLVVSMLLWLGLVFAEAILSHHLIHLASEKRDS